MGIFKLDGKELPFEAGDTIISAAYKQGIEIPHYCWHPGLSIAANCRMCLVEIKSQRPMALPVVTWDAKKNEYVDAIKIKLQPACQIEVSEGMEVVSKSDAVAQAQKSTQEFLLLNHPVDCPICDQAGECKLQDYWMEHQGQLKRKETEPVHKPKAVKFGPTIVYDAERCIMCTRCVRFCDEVVGDHVLDMRERGNRNEITLSPGRELDHDYTLMTEHVCPVGALTSKDFRFKARVWFLRSAPSVCTGCATGCNSWVDYDPRNQQVYRLRPRDNEAVNKYWMCDDGMMSYKAFHEDRLVTARVRQDGVVNETSLETAISEAGAVLSRASKLAVVFSAQHSTEDNFVLSRLGKDKLGSTKLYLAAKGGWKPDTILRNADNNPNRKGAERVAGAALKDMKALVEAVRSGEVDAILSLSSVAEMSVGGHGQALSADELETLSKVPHINLSERTGPLTRTASIVLPIAAVSETSGSFVNAAGTSQSFKAATKAPFLPGWQVLTMLAKKMGHELGLAQFAEVRKALPSAPAATA